MDLDRRSALPWFFTVRSARQTKGRHDNMLDLLPGPHEVPAASAQCSFLRVGNQGSENSFQKALKRSELEQRTISS